MEGAMDAGQVQLTGSLKLKIRIDELTGPLSIGYYSQMQSRHVECASINTSNGHSDL